MNPSSLSKPPEYPLPLEKSEFASSCGDRVSLITIVSKEVLWNSRIDLHDLLLKLKCVRRWNVQHRTGLVGSIEFGNGTCR